jgi:hypothetical protein
MIKSMIFFSNVYFIFCVIGNCSKNKQYICLKIFSFFIKPFHLDGFEEKEYVDKEIKEEKLVV